MLICDEITSALDERTSEHVLEMLRARQRETGLAIVWATHDVALARRFSDATLDLDRGRPQLAARADGELADPGQRVRT